MPISSQLLELLVCPSSSSSLVERDGGLASADGREFYPLINQVPWLLPNPRNSLVDWGAKLNHFNQVLVSEIQTLELEVKRAKNTHLLRLTALLNGKRAFMRRVSELLFPVVGAGAATKASYDALRDKAPQLQNLLSYEANLYRDWVWGEEENALTLSLVNEHLDALSAAKVIVLGAGAGRLALDVHRSIKPAITVATDINPLLVMAAEHLLSGQDLQLYEFPLQPRNSQCVALEHTICAEKKPENFHFVFSDATKPSFKHGAFDVVLTPWLIDIQPLELGRFLRQLNQYLPLGGHWVNFGSIVFNQGRDALCYSVDEIVEVAKTQGFEIGAVREHEIPYLKSPYNAGYRMERVWSWTAKKVAEVTALKLPQVLPAWALDHKQAIPSADYLAQFVSTHRIYAQLAAEVDGKTSLAKIARKFAKQNKMDESEALVLVQNFFIDLFQQNSM